MSLCPCLRISNASIQEDITYRNACRACASCCGAFRNWRYPSLYRSQSRSSWLRVRVGVRRTHFGWGLKRNRQCPVIYTAIREGIPGDAVVSIEGGSDRGFVVRERNRQQLSETQFRTCVGLAVSGMARRGSTGRHEGHQHQQEHRHSEQQRSTLCHRSICCSTDR